MTKALEQAFKEASELPEDEQDALAKAIRAEIGAEGEWDKALAESQKELEHLADEAVADRRAGHAPRLDPNKM